MIAMGSWIGASVDTYARIIRHRNLYRWVIIINDGLFWIFQSLLIFFVLLQVNEGEMRFYILLALLCGYAAYRSLLQNAYRRVLEKTIHFIVKTYKFLTNLVLTFIINPTKVLLKLLYRLCIMVVSGILVLLVFIGKIIFMPFIYLFKKLFKRYRIFTNLKQFYMKIVHRLKQIFVKK